MGSPSSTSAHEGAGRLIGRSRHGGGSRGLRAAAHVERLGRTEDGDQRGRSGCRIRTSGLAGRPHSSWAVRYPAAAVHRALRNAVAARSRESAREDRVATELFLVRHGEAVAKDRKSVAQGQSVDLGGRRIIKTKKTI